MPVPETIACQLGACQSCPEPGTCSCPCHLPCAACGGVMPESALDWRIKKSVHLSAAEPEITITVHCSEECANA